MRALVLSGGGMFGAWQAGAWAALAAEFKPDLIVGASVGSLNGYAIASGTTPEMLREMWLDENLVSFSGLHANLQAMVTRHRLSTDFAVVVTDLFRMKPVIYRGDAVTWRHLAASCAVPLALPQVRLEGRWCSDGGLLNSLPIYAAIQLGATEIVGLQVLPEFPLPVLRPFVRVFRAVFGVYPPEPPSVKVRVIEPSVELGSLSDSIKFRRQKIEAWLELGYRDAQKTFPLGIGLSDNRP